MTCLKTQLPQTLQRNHLQHLEQDGAQHQTMLKMTVGGMMTHRPVKVVDLVQDLAQAEEHSVGGCQTEMTVVLVEEEVVVAEAGVDSVTLMETMIPIHHEVAVEDSAEVIQKMTRVAVVGLVALEVALAVDSNHPMRMETTKMIILVVVEVSEVEEVDLEGTEVAPRMMNQDLDLEEGVVVEGLVTEGADSTLLMTTIMKTKTLVVAALAVKEAAEGLEEVLVLQMTMEMKNLAALATEEAVVEGLETREEGLVLQMTMMMMIPEDLVAEEAVEASEEEGVDLALVAMMERKTLAQALAHGEGALVDLDHLVMEILEVAVLVASEQPMMMTMIGDRVDGVVGGDEVAPVAVTMMMATLTLQNLVVRCIFTSY